MSYRLVQRVTRVDIPENTGGFRLRSRRALNASPKLREQHRFIKGLFAWIGFPCVAVVGSLVRPRGTTGHWESRPRRVDLIHHCAAQGRNVSWI